MVMGVPAGRIRPQPPVPSLVTSADRFTDVGAADWQRGISFMSACPQSYTWPFACTNPLTQKTIQPNMSRVDVQPFVIYTPERCTLPVDENDLDAFVTAANDIHTASALARTLWMGSGYDTADVISPTLRRAAVPILVDGVLDLDDAFAALLTHYEQATGGFGGATIHMPAVFAPVALGGGSGGARVCWPEGNIYRGPNGCKVVPGPGYPLGSSLQGVNGHGPLLSAGPPEVYMGNPPGWAWVYVSGPVEFDVTAEVLRPDPGRDRMQARTNLYELWAERSAIVRFDPCSVFAAEVSLPVVLLEES